MNLIGTIMIILLTLQFLHTAMFPYPITENESVSNKWDYEV